MTQQEKDDLLTEARKRYPIGTVFVPPFGCKDKLTVTGNIFLLPFGDRRIIVETDKGDGRVAGLINTAAISTRSGEWAEIVSKPEETMIEGQWYKAVNKNNHSEWLFKYSANRFGKAEGNNTEFSKCIELDTKNKSLNNWIGDNEDYTISKVTNLEEVYLHFPEERPKEKKKYTISELKYPIAIHITSKEQYDKVRKVIKLIDYSSDRYYYLAGGNGCSEGKYTGQPSVPGNYINIEFEDIIFPEEITKEQIMDEIVVKCDSLEEWNIVQKFCNKNYSYQLSKDGCIRLSEGSYWSISNKEAIQKEGYTVISFNNFKKEYLKEEPINTYGLKVGDTLRADILNKWGNSGNFLHGGSITFGKFGVFCGDRILDSFYNSPAGVIFKPSGCASGEFGLKAEGFKEFMDNFDKPVKEDKPKFEAGKWYKYTREDIKEPNYAKYSANQSVNDRFYYDEFISINGWKKGHNWSILTVNPVLLTDLSEIQQYLPDGHEDKIMEPKKQSLKGRYLKALVDNPSGISNAKKGDYFRIDDESRTICTLLKNNTSHWSCTSDSSFELMPEGFNPTQLNNKVIDLTNTKIWIGDNPELSKQVQEKAFELGWKWWNNKGVRNTQGTSLYFDSGRYISYSDSKTSDYSNNNKYKEIKPEDLGIVLNPKIEYLNLEFNGKAFCPQQDLLSLQENDGRIDPSVTKTKSIKTELVSEQSIILF